MSHAHGVERRSLAWTRPLLSGALFLAMGAGTGHAVTFVVTSAADAGANTFRDGVAAASGNPAIDTIEFDGPLVVTLATPVIYTGGQNLTLLGDGSTLRGDGSKDDTWDAGLFVSSSAADITIEDLTFSDSFNNGVGIFIPFAGGTVDVSLDRVTIERSRFHGLYIDNQITDGYNTDDVPHPNCDDPWPVNANAGVTLWVLDSSILDNGTVNHAGDDVPGDDDYDASLATGCPVDFDGIRVDDGGNGGITGRIEDSIITGNRADGVEYDERGNGDVWSWTRNTRIEQNGDTGTVDTDDGFDIDEADNGDLIAYFDLVAVKGNFDEGIDMSELGNGSARVTVVDSEASGNEDEGVKVDDTENGSVWLTILRSTVNGSLSQQGIDVVEMGNGDLTLAIEDSEVNENDNDGMSLEEQSRGNLRVSLLRTDVMENGDHAVSAEQAAPGAGALVATDSDLTGNADSSLDLTNITPTLVGTPIDP